MTGRERSREVRVGLAVVVAAAALLGLMSLASDGPGFLANTRAVDVVFRDGQGIREGSSVRVAGIDAGRVTSVDLIEVEGSLRARVRLALPRGLAAKLKADVKVAIQPSLAGQSRVNIISSGQSGVGLVPGQIVQGVESTFFDPILEQVGLGPVERGAISHTIAEVRTTVDAAGPRLRQIVGTAQEIVAGLKETSEAVRPNVEATGGHIEDIARRIDAQAPRIEAALARLDSLTAQTEQMLAENRANIAASMAGTRDLIATVNDIATKDRVKVEKLLDGLDGTRIRADRVLFQADQIATQGNHILTSQRADLERTIANVRDATDWASRLVQKIYANPFVISPFYKPTPDDVRIQAVYDVAQIFSKGARELHDAVKTIDALQAGAKTPEQQQALAKIYERAYGIEAQLNATAQQLANGLKSSGRK